MKVSLIFIVIQVRHLNINYVAFCNNWSILLSFFETNENSEVITMGTTISEVQHFHKKFWNSLLIIVIFPIWEIFIFLNYKNLNFFLFWWKWNIVYVTFLHKKLFNIFILISTTCLNCFYRQKELYSIHDVIIKWNIILFLNILTLFMKLVI